MGSSCRTHSLALNFGYLTQRTIVASIIDRLAMVGTSRLLEAHSRGKLGHEQNSKAKEEKPHDMRRDIHQKVSTCQKLPPRCNTA